MIYKTQRKFASVILSIFLLAGCYDELQSEKQLISETMAVNPVSEGRYFLIQIQFEEGDELIEVLYEDTTSGRHIYQEFNPKQESSQKGGVIFHKVPNLLSFFTSSHYIVTATRPGKNDRFTYFFLEKDGEEWSFYKSTAEKFFDSYRKLSLELDNLDDESSYTRPFNYFNIKAVDSTTASLFKQIAIQKYKAEQDEKQRIADEKARLERQKQQQRIANLDKEPTEAEMNAAIRGTFAGQLLNARVQKLGACRKAGSYDYYCRYNYLGANWGNFWKQGNRWYFQIAEN